MPLLMPSERAAHDLLPPAASPQLVAAVQHALALENLLEQEFEALKVQDLDAFEQMQIRKLEIFDKLNSLTGVGTAHSRLDNPEWDGFKNLISDCRELHRRNEVLIIRKLDAIKGTLQTLHGSDATASVEVYDRMGRISRRRGGRGFEEA
jgi:flagellar biosynthesis/type III secretory pathway chaperone